MVLLRCKYLQIQQNDHELKDAESKYFKCNADVSTIVETVQHTVYVVKYTHIQRHVTDL